MKDIALPLLAGKGGDNRVLLFRCEKVRSWVWVHSLFRSVAPRPASVPVIFLPQPHQRGGSSRKNGVSLSKVRPMLEGELVRGKLPFRNILPRGAHRAGARAARLGSVVHPTNGDHLASGEYFSKVEPFLGRRDSSGVSPGLRAMRHSGAQLWIPARFTCKSDSAVLTRRGRRAKRLFGGVDARERDQ